MKLFKDLPNTDTPINAEMLNQIQHNLVVVSKTEPTGDNREKVWIQKGKNLFDKNNIKKLVGYIDGAGNFNTGNTDTKTLYINCMPNTNYVVSRVAGQYFKIASFSEEIKNAIHMINGNILNYTASELTINTGNNAKYLAVTYYNGGTDTLTEQEILDSLQIEQGTTATDYEAYIEHKIYVLNDNGIYEEFMSKESTEDFQSKVTFNETPANVSFLKNGNVIEITYQGESIAHTQDQLLFTLPERYRPTKPKFFPFVKNANVYGNVVIGADGPCKVNHLNDTAFVGRVYFTITYII